MTFDIRSLLIFQSRKFHYWISSRPHPSLTFFPWKTPSKYSRYLPFPEEEKKSVIIDSIDKIEGRLLYTRANKYLFQPETERQISKRIVDAVCVNCRCTVYDNMGVWGIYTFLKKGTRKIRDPGIDWWEKEAKWLLRDLHFWNGTNLAITKLTNAASQIGCRSNWDDDRFRSRVEWRSGQCSVPRYIRHDWLRFTLGWYRSCFRLFFHFQKRKKKQKNKLDI